jgi:hypothetical protein
MGEPIPSAWSTTDVVPMPEVIRVAGVPARHVYHMVERGQIQPLPDRGRFNAILVTRDTAINFMMAVALAERARIAIATAYRAIEAGASFPVPTDTS